MVKAAVNGKGVSENSAITFKNMNFAATRLSAELFGSDVSQQFSQGNPGSPLHCDRNDVPDGAQSAYYCENAVLNVVGCGFHVSSLVSCLLLWTCV